MAFQSDFSSELNPAKWFRTEEELDGCPLAPAPRTPDGNLNVFLKALVDNDVHLLDLFNSLASQISSEITAQLNQSISTKLYPVGSIFITTLNLDPSVILGVGTWEKFSSGRVLVGQDPLNISFSAVEQTGGSLTSVSTTVSSGSHNHGGNTGGHVLTLAQLPPHNHGDARVGSDDSVGNNGTSGSDTNFGPFNVMQVDGDGEAHSHPISTSGTHTHQVTTSTLQPYIVCFIWKRVA